MTHPEMDDLYELFILGALEPAETAAIEEHVGEQCPYCLSHLQAALLVTSAMSGIADPVQPPARLRARVLNSVRGHERPQRNWLFATAGLGVACAALLALALWSANRANSYQSQIAELSRQREQLRSAVEILSRKETRTVQYGLADNRPHGRVFVNPQRGLVFVGSQLPQLAENRTFEFWLIPNQGAPQPAGLFRANAAGNYVNVQTTPVDTARIKAVAVSVEPRDGSPAPTTTPILVVPLG